MPDVAIRIFCDAMHRAAHKSRRGTDSHGPHGPRTDQKATLPRVIAREQRDRGNPYPFAIARHHRF